MATWWYAIVLIVLAAAAFLYMRDRGRSTPHKAPQADQAASPVDFVKDREATRVAHMSADDRAWEAASLERQQARQASEHPKGEGF